VEGVGRPVVVAVDGPAGSGKSTLASRLAAALDLPYVNTGLMYRAVTLRALREGVSADDGDALAGLAHRVTFDLDRRVTPPRLLIDGAPPDPALTSIEVEQAVSRISRHPPLRTVLRDEQRRLGAGGAVMEGRDIGSVVFPDAALRVVLGAGHRERATRRAREREAADLPGVERAIAERDELDARNVPAVEPDLEVDTTGMDADAVFALVLAAVRERLRGDR
jgi:cytidylate kinase